MKIGLALSGGGFRATLYHLGMIRFLRDAGILPNVTHITSVSGGSIFAAHLVLNWARYNGSPGEFDAAAAELLAFVRLDVRNRIVRRYPLALVLRWLGRLVGRSNRRLTRAGLLEHDLKKYLYGDTSLFQLPEHPRLHLLATNLSEGGICSFSRDGLSTIRRETDRYPRFERSSIRLATVPMAVAASSAFPGFFPPMELTGTDVGARSGEFGRQVLTDGGVFDNLGVRMFRFLAESSESSEPPCDGVLVSDVGKPFQIDTNARAGGLIRTAMRSSDILMDRVWQLENDAFSGAAGFVFARVTDVVDPQEDPTALHPEVQRQVACIRTDLDRFSDLEISSLIRHGYTVGRKACRAHPDLFGAELPINPPWDPIFEPSSRTATAAAAADATASRRAPTAVTREARLLHASGLRRIWGRLFDYRDWVSYVYVPIIVPILVLLPYFIAKSYQRSRQVSQIVESLAQGSRDLEQMTQLLKGPVTPWIGEKKIEKLSAEDKADLTGFQILQDSRIIDLRNWAPATEQNKDSNSLVYGYRRLKVLKKSDNVTNNLFRISVLALSPDTQVRFPPQQLSPKLYSRSLDSSPPGHNLMQFQVGVDFQKVPPGESIDIIYEHLSPGLFVREGAGSNSLAFLVEADTVELNRWLLLPQGKGYRSSQLIRYKTAKPEVTENVKVTTKYLADDNSILAFKLLSIEAGYTYEISWLYE